MQFLQAVESDVEAPQAVGQEVHAIQRDRGERVEMTGYFEPRRRATENALQVGVGRASLRLAANEEVGGDGQKHQAGDGSA